jgi:L-threonylcarbamoyladenylate synthase
MPAHPIALALIGEAGVPIAAPSANRFTELSPTTAEHVRRSLGDQVGMILDGGPTDLGIESTVLSLTGSNAVLLRPGMISCEQIEAVIGPIQTAASLTSGPHPAPGMHPRHYSPRTPLILTEHGRLPDRGSGAYLWLRTPAQAGRLIGMPADAPAYAAKLYAILHQLDSEGWDWIAVERPPSDPEWEGILDRLERAAQA